MAKEKDINELLTRTNKLLLINIVLLGVSLFMIIFMCSLVDSGFHKVFYGFGNIIDLLRNMRVY